MHVRWAGKLVVLVVGSGFVWLGFLILFTISDYLSRGWSPVSASHRGRGTGRVGASARLVAGPT